MRSAIESRDGFVFQIIGDAFCAAFHTAKDGLVAAIESQRKLQTENWEGTALKVRMGLHTGSAELHGTEYRGYLTMAKVQRVMSVAYGGQVLISNTSADLLHNELPAGIILRDMKEHRLKGLPELERLWQMVAPELQQDFPPLSSLNEIPNNLPLQLTTFIGREKEIDQIKSRLEKNRLVTLTGSGGVGKTRLSIQVALELLGEYPNGVWLVELAPLTDPALVTLTVCAALDVTPQGNLPALNVLTEYLKSKKILLVMDNCEHLVDACARMADRILHAAPNVRILASSREALGIAGEVTYRVPSLGLPDPNRLPPVDSLSQYEAVKLFIDRATAAVPSFSVTNDNAPFLAQICHRLDGIPLAIELAAAKIRVLSLEQIAKRLDDRFSLLTSGSRTALERHQTLRAAIDWSYNLLPPNEQILFRSLSVFIGGWTLEAAESVYEVESSSSVVLREDMLVLLEALINKSIVIKEETGQDTRYRMLETMRQYANEKLVESEESDSLRDRHLEYFLNLAETAEPHLIRAEQLDWLAQLDANYENLRAALEWALDLETAAPSLRLCAALGWFWWVRGYYLEGTKWLRNALDRPSQPTELENRIRVKALYHDADLANWLDDIEQMKRSAEQSLALAKDASDKRDLAIARFYVGWALDRSYDDEHAIPLMQESLKDFHEIHDVYWESVAYRWLANILVERGDMERAEKVSHHLELARRAGERKNLAEALGNYGYYLFSSNRVDEARTYAEEANVLFKKMGIRLSELRHFFAHLAWLKGDLKETREILMEMKEYSYALGDRTMRCMAISDLGFLALETGDLSQAHIYLEQALVIAREIGNKDFVAMRLAEIGNAFFMEEKFIAFKQNYKDSFRLGKDLRVLTKRSLLLLVLDPLHRRAPQGTTQILGAIYHFAPPTHPLWKRYYDRVEAYARDVLGPSAFESAFAEGQKLSLEEALDFALKIVEET